MRGVTPDREGTGHDDERDRGRAATTPAQVPARGWRDVVARTRREAKDDRASLLAAGVACYALLAIVPAVAALAMLYGIAADPDTIERQVADTLGAAPQEVRDLVETQLRAAHEESSGATAVGLAGGLALALWSASSGMSHLIDAVNAAHNQNETRGFIRRRALALTLTVGSVVFVTLSFVGIALLPAIVAETGLAAGGRIAIGAIRWVLLLAIALVGLALLYRYGPDRDDARWEWVSPGAVIATVMWLVASVGFSVYTANFARYNETYGALGAVVVVMLWLFITALAVILGAELNAELERQTRHDTTEGHARPLGRRGAYGADTVGETVEQLSSANERAM